MSHILRDFAPEVLANAIDANQIGFYVDLGRSPRIELNDDPEVLWFLTGLPFPAFNRVLQARFEANDVHAKIEAVLAPFKARQVPMVWHTGPSTRPVGLGQHLLAHGLAHTQSEPGLAVDLLALSDEPLLPSGLKVKQVNDLKTLEMWVGIFTCVFAMVDGIGEVAFEVEAELSLGRDLPRRLYVGFLEGEPVASSMLFLGAGVAGVYGVGTVPDARRRGIGMAMTQVPLLEARALGYRIGTLHASSMGVGLYRRLGFQEYCVLDWYAKR